TAAGAGALFFQQLSATPEVAPSPQDRSDGHPPKRPDGTPLRTDTDKKPPVRPDDRAPPRRESSSAPSPAEVDQAGPLLVRVNALRGAAGLPPVALDRGLSRGCALHARYLARNSTEGKTAVRHGVSAAGEPLPALDVLMASGVRRLRFLDPRLLRVGVGTD